MKCHLKLHIDITLHYIIEQYCCKLRMSATLLNEYGMASVKSRLVLPIWYQLTQVVPEKGLYRVCVYIGSLIKGKFTSILHEVWRQHR